MNNTDRFFTVCPQSGKQDKGYRFGGGVDQCECCGKLVYIAQTGRVARHRARFTQLTLNEAYQAVERLPHICKRLPRGMRRAFGHGASW